MENLNAEQIKKALKCCGEYTHGTTCNNCPYMHIELADNEICSNRMSQDALALINSQEQRIKELTEENERLRRVGVPDNDVYIRLTDAKHAIMDYIGEQTVSKYASEVECKAARSGAEGAMNELDYLIPVKVAPIADTVRKMRSLLHEKKQWARNDICDMEVVDIDDVDQIAKEIIEQK